MLLAPLFYVQVAFSQQPVHPPASTAIHLDVVVTPKSGPPVADLQQSDFTVLDNKAPQPILSFQAVAGDKAPIEVVIVIDAVNTSFQRVAYVRGELDKFLRADEGRLAHPVALALFTDKGIQLQKEFSSDGNAIAGSLDGFTVGLREIDPSAGVYGADERLDLSLKALQELIGHEAPRPGRKLILWISPGWPILSGPGIQISEKLEQGIFASIVGLSTALREARITLYSVDSLGVEESVGRTNYYQQFIKGVGKSSQVVLGDVSLQVLAVQSGGLALSSTGVALALQECIDDTKAYYQLTFASAPAEQPNEYHHIEVRVAKPGLVARTRQGYYAQPPPRSVPLQ
jgi:VWFA-related protein